MGTDVAMVMAYRNMGDEHRATSFDVVRDYYVGLGLDVWVEPGESDETFTRASAINAGVRRCPADVIIQADPDSLVTGSQLNLAVQVAQAAPGLVVAFTEYRYLNRDVTSAYRRRVFHAGHLPPTPAREFCDEFGEGGVGNVVAFSRETWRLCRGFDERFPLWGGDDAVFAYSAEAMTGRPTRRVVGNMVHLWHPRLPQSDPDHAAYAEQFAIVARYRDAARVGPDAVRALVESRPPVD